MASAGQERYPFPTLPDYLGPDLELVFVGINPGLYSVERGHYFARTTSRFWPAFSRSRLSAAVRAGLGREALGPEDDSALLEFGIGFTDVVKRPSRGAADVKPAHYREWAPRLLARLERFRPPVACFHGLTAYRAFVQFGLSEPKGNWTLGPQPLSVGGTGLFVVPNPSPANAHFKLQDQIAWYDRLAEFVSSLYSLVPGL
ncbi:MAG TPA: mismatch-specific DNA-glycosylase [Chloroflexota bacterium]|nr:mismatch-specific DNA-glycosylase [Chloroflexota bacterium]